jgi:hypothetical protein
MTTSKTYRFILSLTASLTMAATTAVFAGKDNDDAGRDRARRPKLVLKTDRSVGVAPARVTLTADLVGGADDYEDFYCLGIEWDWGDGTQSDSSFDCQPYQPNVSKITRHFSIQHLFSEGQYRVTFRLKRNDKALASADANLLVS